ncbi:MAG: hypothetical protein COA89_12735 [Acidithiobacillus sp.]|jgi:hypothetical protein|nr:MAG: hypothetical protein COA89_12735 [Acidithiobacillus sp.]
MAQAPALEDKITVENGRLVVDVALTGGIPSQSGKTLVFFSTHGNIEIGDGFTIGINMYRKRAK